MSHKLFHCSIIIVSFLHLNYFPVIWSCWLIIVVSFLLVDWIVRWQHCWQRCYRLVELETMILSKIRQKRIVCWQFSRNTIPLLVFGADFSCFEETIFLGDGKLDTVEDRSRFMFKIRICCAKITPPQKKFFTPPVPDTDLPAVLFEEILLLFYKEKKRSKCQCKKKTKILEQ